MRERKREGQRFSESETSFFSHSFSLSHAALILHRKCATCTFEYFIRAAFPHPLILFRYFY